MGKGQSFERKISEELSNWFTDNETSLAFYRTAGSGGRATNRRKGNKEINKDDFGDIKAELPIGKPLTDFFSIELKTGYAKKSKSKSKKNEGKEVIKVVNWDILDIIDSTQQKPQFYDFWEQCERDSSILSKEPLLIFRRNNKQPCIAMYTDIFTTFITKCGHPEFEFLSLNFCSENLCFPSISICNLYKFFEWTKGKVKPFETESGSYQCSFIILNLKRTIYKRGRGIK